MSKTYKEMELEQMMNKIHHVDCLEFMKQVPDDYFDLILTDPPYGVGMGKYNRKMSTADNENGFTTDTNYTNGDWDKTIPSTEVFKELFRVSKNQIIFGGNYFSLPPSRGWIYWQKKLDLANGKTFADGELAYTSFDKNLKQYIYGWNGFDYLNNPDGERKHHPTGKPFNLFKHILRDYAISSNVKTVFDPFIGSGTTAIACKSLGLDWCGCELEADYVEIANKRLEAVQGSLF